MKKADFNLELIKDDRTCRRLAETLASQTVFSLDIETTEWWNRQKEKISVIQLAYRHGPRVKVAIIDAFAALDFNRLKSVLEAETITKVVHNAAFDVPRLVKHYAIAAAPVYDTMRVSTADQNLDLQKDALAKFGCEEIQQDVASGAKSDRGGLNEAKKFLRKGDTLVVWKLERLRRSLRNLSNIVNELEQRHISFVTLQETIDTRTNNGKLFFHIFGALAEYEREIIRERTKAGLTAARARGRAQAGDDRRANRAGEGNDGEPEVKNQSNLPDAWNFQSHAL